MDPLELNPLSSNAKVELTSVNSVKQKEDDDLAIDEKILRSNNNVELTSVEIFGESFATVEDDDDSEKLTIEVKEEVSVTEESVSPSKAKALVKTGMTEIINLLEEAKRLFQKEEALDITLPVLHTISSMSEKPDKTPYIGDVKIILAESLGSVVSVGSLIVQIVNIKDLNDTANEIEEEIAKNPTNDVEVKELNKTKRKIRAQIKQKASGLLHSVAGFGVKASSLVLRGAKFSLSFAPAIQGVSIASGGLAGVLSLLGVISQGLSLKGAVDNVLKAKKWIRNPKFKEKARDLPDEREKKIDTLKIDLNSLIEETKLNPSKRKARKIDNKISDIITELGELQAQKVNSVEEMLNNRKALEEKRLESSKKEFNELINKIHSSSDFNEIEKELRKSGIHLDTLVDSLPKAVKEKLDKKMLENLSKIQNEITLRRLKKHLDIKLNELEKPQNNENIVITPEIEKIKKQIETMEQHLEHLEDSKLIELLSEALTDEGFKGILHTEFARHQDTLTFSTLKALKTMAPKKASLEKRLLNFKVGVEGALFGVSIVASAASIALTIASFAGGVPPIAAALPSIFSLFASGGAMILGLIFYGSQKPNRLKSYLKLNDAKILYNKIPLIISNIKVERAQKKLNKQEELLAKLQKINVTEVKADTYLDTNNAQINNKKTPKPEEIENKKKLIADKFNQDLYNIREKKKLLETKQKSLQEKISSLEAVKIDAGAKDFARGAKVGKSHSEFQESYIKKTTGDDVKVDVFDDIVDKLIEGNIVTEGPVEPILGFLEDQMGIKLATLLGEDKPNREEIKNAIKSYFGMDTDAFLKFINNQNAELEGKYG